MKVLVLVALAVCILGATAQGGLNFLAIGDWGGESDQEPTSPGEIAVASGMSKVASEIGSQFVLALGDNFYSEGIQGDCHSPRFNLTFDDVFTQAPLQTPWFVLAGNHDHYGNVSAQIAYTQLSPRWNFPTYYYNKVFPFHTSSGVKTFEVIFIDTVLLAGVADHEDTFGELKGVDAVAAETQWQWIQQTIANSTADYLWVAGHYPVWSVCEHGPTQVLVDVLRPMMITHKVTGFMSGHDHCLEYIDDGAGPVYVLSGAGRECCYDATNSAQIPAGSLKYLLAGAQQTIQGGFVSFQVGDSYLNVVYYDQSGNTLYTTPNIYPRK